MRVRDALKASCAIPFYFSPVRSPFGDDLLVDGCITDCEWRVHGEEGKGLCTPAAWCATRPPASA